MQRVEQRLQIVPEPKLETEDEVVKVQEPEKLIQLLKQLELPELCFQERLDIAKQLRKRLWQPIEKKYEFGQVKQELTIRVR